MNRRAFARALGISLAGLSVLIAPSARAQNPPAVPAAVPRLAEHVFVISFDGGKPAVMKQSRMPNFVKTMAEGAGTWEASTIFPSITLSRTHRC
jgi:hypothetical protein